MTNKYPLWSPAPNWTSIFTLRDDLTPPGYAETLIYTQEHPYSEIKQAKVDAARSKKKKPNSRKKSK